MGNKTPPWPPYPKWTTARWWSFLRSALRKAWVKWPVRYDVLRNARRAYGGKDKRQKYEYKCAHCKAYFKQKEVSVDHITPVGGLTSFEELPKFVETLFSGEDNLQVLCKKCHDKKTQEERDANN